jgi:hypothetical protein
VAFMQEEEVVGPATEAELQESEAAGLWMVGVQGRMLDAAALLQLCLARAENNCTLALMCRCE